MGAGLRPREAEIIYYFDIVFPTDDMYEEESVLDVSQSLHRALSTVKLMPALTPRSRMLLRRRQRWLLAPEALAVQGYPDPDQACLFSHRQIVDLCGNAFHADSLMVSMATALASAPSF